MSYRSKNSRHVEGALKALKVLSKTFGQKQPHDQLSAKADHFEKNNEAVISLSNTVHSPSQSMPASTASAKEPFHHLEPQVDNAPSEDIVPTEHNETRPRR